MARAPKKLERVTFPIPFVKVLDDRRVIALPPAGFGCLWRILFHYWLTGCEPLSESEDRLFVIAQAPRATWRWHRDTILAVCKDYAPALAHAYQVRLTKRSLIKTVSERGSAQRQKQLIEMNQRRALERGLPVKPRQAVQQSPVHQAGGFRDL